MQQDANQLEEIRSRHELRELTKDEEGLPLSRLPGGVYGFTYSPGQAEMPLFADRGYHSFEIHKRKDGSEHLIGYVTRAEKVAIDGARSGAEIRVYPSAWGESDRLVSVDLRLMVPSHRSPTRQEGNPLPVLLS